MNCVNEIARIQISANSGIPSSQSTRRSISCSLIVPTYHLLGLLIVIVTTIMTFEPFFEINADYL